MWSGLNVFTLSLGATVMPLVILQSMIIRLNKLILIPEEDGHVSSHQSDVVVNRQSFF